MSDSTPILIDTALYFAPTPKCDPLKALQAIAAKVKIPVHLGTPDEVESLPVVAPQWLPIEEYSAPDAEGWKYSAIDLPEALCPRLAQAKQVFLMHWLLTGHNPSLENRFVARRMAEMAAVTGGFLWDEHTRQLFSPAAWKETRINSYEKELVNVTQHVVMHSYRNAKHLRVVTLGMAKFGLPDICVEPVISNVNHMVGEFVNVLLQISVENGRLAPGKMTLDLAKIRHPIVHKKMLDFREAKGSGVAPIRLKAVAPQAGDADNDLLQLDFDLPGKTGIERCQAGLEACFGGSDGLVYAAGDDRQLVAASERARAKLPQLFQRFMAGLGVGESFLVKGPFVDEEGGNEYMWVEVTSWRDNTLKGILVNEPMSVKGLVAGAEVLVLASAVYDYIWRHSDGRMEGNETGQILAGRGN